MNIEDKKEYYSVTFEGEDFTETWIESTEFDNCTFVGCNFSEATFSRSNFVDCEFLKCNLSNVKMEYSKFSDVKFHDSKLIGIDWTKVAWPRLLFCSPVQFYDCILSDSTFNGLSLQDLILESCIAHRVDFRDGDFKGSNFANTDFSGSMFSHTNLSDADFSGATDFDIDLFSNKLEKAKFDRFEAVRLLTCLNIELI